MTCVQYQAVEHKASPLEATPAPPQGLTRILLALLEFYRRWLSPALHSLNPGGCKYLPTCSEYASLAIATHGPLWGSLLALRRLLRCNPFAHGGLDPVPPAPVSHNIPHEPLP